MQHDRICSSTCTHPDPGASTPDEFLRQGLLGALFVAAVAVLSLPEARTLSATFGWTPLWLLGLPASAWVALQARRLSLRTEVGTGSTPRRWRSTTASSRRRNASGGRAGRRARAA